MVQVSSVQSTPSTPTDGVSGSSGERQCNRQTAAVTPHLNVVVTDEQLSIASSEEQIQGGYVIDWVIITSSKSLGEDLNVSTRRRWQARKIHFENINNQMLF